MLLLLLLVAAATTQSAVCEVSCSLNAELHGCGMAHAMDMTGTGSSDAAMCLHTGAGVTWGGQCLNECLLLLSSTSVADVAPLNAAMGQVILPLVPVLFLKSELRTGAGVDLASLTYIPQPYFFTLSLRV